MGFFKTLKDSFSKNKIIKSATEAATNGNINSSAEIIYDHISSNDQFYLVIKDFHIQLNDIKNLLVDMTFAGLGINLHGHYVPVSALLFPDTLAYLMRIRSGQVDKAKAFNEILSYFKNNEIVFIPERRFH